MGRSRSPPWRSPTCRARRRSRSTAHCSAPDDPWHGTTSVVPTDAVRDWLTAERERGTCDILTFASRTMWRGLLRQGLIDELHLMVGPAALGGGTPAFPEPVA